MGKPNIVLASMQLQRKEMLLWILPTFSVVESNIDETTMEQDTMVITSTFAEAKARAVSSVTPNSIVIGCDTVIGFHNHVLVKPPNEPWQREMISMVRGNWTDVVTSVYMINTTTQETVSQSHITKVLIRKFENEEMEAYIVAKKGRNMPGGFDLYDPDFKFIDHIEGCYTNSIGFPLCTVSDMLWQLGIEPSVNVKKVVKEKTGQDC